MKRVISGVFLVVVLCLAVMNLDGEISGAQVGDTAVLKWRGGKKAVFFLGFDDSCQSHVKNAIPELEKRGLVGTFYINPGNGPLNSRKDDWHKRLPKSTAVVYGNHTMTHCGAKDAAQLDIELMGCHQYIYSCYPERKKPFLVSFARPGGVPWTVTDVEKKTSLSKYHLIQRPPFVGYPLTFKDREAVCALVDKAIEEGDMGHHDFHGIGGDWHVMPMDLYVSLLDKLVACRKDLWVTDHISWHKYLTERSGARVNSRITGNSIKVNLESSTDTALYDLPLTLETHVPQGWHECTVKQGDTKSCCAVAAGKILYDALPNGGGIVISKLR